MRDIPSYENQYAITENGQVWSYISNKFLKPFYKNGYERVELLGTPYLVHRLVAITYLPNPENKPTVDHIDRNKTNNHVSNLRWATEQEQAINKDYLNKKSLKNQGCCKEKPVAMCNATTHEIIKTFPSMTAAAEYLGNKQIAKNISAVCQGKRLTTYGYYWCII
jgi:hypothetical protein